jgi:hypothetical protein
MAVNIKRERERERERAKTVPSTTNSEKFSMNFVLPVFMEV